jgi:hypothetical protein
MTLGPPGWRGISLDRCKIAEEHPMKTVILAALAASTVAGAVAVSAAPADAQPWGYWHRPYYAYWHGYRPYYGYAYGPGYFYGPRPYWHRPFRPYHRRFYRW